MNISCMWLYVCSCFGGAGRSKNSRSWGWWTNGYKSLTTLQYINICWFGIWVRYVLQIFMTSVSARMPSTTQHFFSKRVRNAQLRNWTQDLCPIYFLCVARKPFNSRPAAVENEKIGWIETSGFNQKAGTGNISWMFFFPCDPLVLPIPKHRCTNARGCHVESCAVGWSCGALITNWFVKTQ